MRLSDEMAGRNSIAAEAKQKVQQMLQGCDPAECVRTRGRDAVQARKHNEDVDYHIERLEDRLREIPENLRWTDAEVKAAHDGLREQIAERRAQRIEIDPAARRAHVLGWLPVAERTIGVFSGEPMLRFRELREIQRSGGTLSAEQSAELSLLARHHEAYRELDRGVRRAKEELAELIPPAIQNRRAAVAAAWDACLALQTEHVTADIRDAAQELRSRIGDDLVAIDMALSRNATWHELEALAMQRPPAKTAKAGKAK